MAFDVTGTWGLRNADAALLSMVVHEHAMEIWWNMETVLRLRLPNPHPLFIAKKNFTVDWFILGCWHAGIVLSKAFFISEVTPRSQLRSWLTQRIHAVPPHGCSSWWNLKKQSCRSQLNSNDLRNDRCRLRFRNFRTQGGCVDLSSIFHHVLSLLIHDLFLHWCMAKPCRGTMVWTALLTCRIQSAPLWGVYPPSVRIILTLLHAWYIFPGRFVQAKPETLKPCDGIARIATRSIRPVR